MHLRIKERELGMEEKETQRSFSAQKEEDGRIAYTVSDPETGAEITVRLRETFKVSTMDKMTGRLSEALAFVLSEENSLSDPKEKAATEKKYRLTDETITVGGRTLYRIEALKDIPSLGVSKGEKGGFIEKEDNLSQAGAAWVSDNALVFDNARVSDNAWVSGNALVFDNARVSDNAWVFNNARVSDNALVSDDALVFHNALVSDDARVSGNALVFHNAWVSDDARVNQGWHKGQQPATPAGREGGPG